MCEMILLVGKQQPASHCGARLTQQKDDQNQDHGKEALVPVRRQPFPYSPVGNQTPAAWQERGAQRAAQARKTTVIRVCR